MYLLMAKANRGQLNVSGVLDGKLDETKVRHRGECRALGCGTTGRTEDLMLQGTKSA